MASVKDFNGRWALITGASAGIGIALRGSWRRTVQNSFSQRDGVSGCRTLQQSFSRTGLRFAL